MADHPTVDHPLYRMWKERHADELALKLELLARAAVRKAAQREWHEAWESYRLHRTAARVCAQRWRWWRGFRAWLLTQSGAPGHRPGDDHGAPALEHEASGDAACPKEKP
jgi:hypothetical protein